jgi:ABC-2 type transport system permease protein/lipopolysaccharide transport system permease protein
MGLAALNVHFKDVRDLLDNLLNLFFFLTPIIYPLRAVEGLPAIWWVVRLNPFTPFSLAYQQVLFFGVVPELSLWLQMGAISLLGWLVGAWLFERLSDTLVEAV